MLISPSVRQKLNQSDHNVTEAEILECFANREPGDCIDTRAWHATNPETRWFVAQTDRGRELKIVYIFHMSGLVEIKSAYSATPNVKRIYEKYRR
jgi:hypothetical protein